MFEKKSEEEKIAIEKAKAEEKIIQEKAKAEEKLAKENADAEIAAAKLKAENDIKEAKERSLAEIEHAKDHAIRKARSRTYYAKSSDLRLVMTPTKKSYVTGTGEKILEGGKTITFSNGRFTTSDPKEIAFMDNYKKKGISKNLIITISDEQKKLSTLQKDIADNAENLSPDSLKAINDILKKAETAKLKGSQGVAGA